VHEGGRRERRGWFGAGQSRREAGEREREREREEGGLGNRDSTGLSRLPEACTHRACRGTTKRPLQDGCGPTGQSERGARDRSANQDAPSTRLLFLNLRARRRHNITRREMERGADNR